MQECGFDSSLILTLLLHASARLCSYVLLLQLVRITTPPLNDIIASRYSVCRDDIIASCHYVYLDCIIANCHCVSLDDVIQLHCALPIFHPCNATSLDTEEERREKF